ncbi:ArsA-related P-loop ATPase [Streptomyces sp. NPDC046821]|uniref:ArsA family ATPase n=1 Tax=Streptomyces sp. NPDC046821 TaxID=3154702 RepID=UPI0033FA5009
MRTVLVTGPGGSGRTAVAAATALVAARRGVRALVLSADPTDSLGAALGTSTGAVPTTVEPGLTAIRLDPANRLRADLVDLQERAASALDMLGATRLDAEELTPLPGSHELALLRALRDSSHGPYDLVVVDLPPAPQALALLALPEQLRRYLRRLLPPERQAARALRPLLGRLAGVPMPAEGLYETAARWDDELAAVQAVIEDEHTTVRLVAEPTQAAADILTATGTGLALHGLRADALLASRVLPDGSTDPWLTDAAARQRKVVAAWHGTYDVHELPHLGRDPHGAGDLLALGTPADVDMPPAVDRPVEDRIAEDGVLVWKLPLPGAVREDLGLVRRGDELVVTVGPLRRIVTLPSALRRCTVAGAGMRDGVLSVRFRPDPGLWPRGE